VLIEDFLVNVKFAAKYKRGDMEIENVSPSYLRKVLPTKLRSFVSVILSFTV
jgi:hypothetical protein